MTPIFQDGSLPFQYIHKHSSSLRQALHTQIANPHIQRARKSSFFFKCWRISSNSTQPHESATRPLQRATGHIKGTHPPLLIPVPWEGANKPMNYGHLSSLIIPTSLIIHERIGLICSLRVYQYNKLDMRTFGQKDFTIVSVPLRSISAGPNFHAWE